MMPCAVAPSSAAKAGEARAERIAASRAKARMRRGSAGDGRLLQATSCRMRRKQRRWGSHRTVSCRFAMQGTAISPGAISTGAGFCIDGTSWRNAEEVRFDLVDCILLRLFLVRNRCGNSEQTMGYCDFRNFGHTISRFPQNILIALGKRRQIAIFEETHCSQGKAGVLAVHFGEGTQCFFERNTRCKHY